MSISRSARDHEPRRQDRQAGAGALGHCRHIRWCPSTDPSACYEAVVIGPILALEHRTQKWTPPLLESIRCSFPSAAHRSKRKTGSTLPHDALAKRTRVQPGITASELGPRSAEKRRTWMGQNRAFVGSLGSLSERTDLLSRGNVDEFAGDSPMRRKSKQRQ
jgi:hypothetical protein